MLYAYFTGLAVFAPPIAAIVASHRSRCFGSGDASLWPPRTIVVIASGRMGAGFQTVPALERIRALAGESHSDRGFST